MSESPTSICQRFGWMFPRTVAAPGDKIVDAMARVTAWGAPVSTSEARRLIKAGGIRIGDRHVRSIDDVVMDAEIGRFIRVGKQRVMLVMPMDCSVEPTKLDMGVLMAVAAGGELPLE